MQKITASSYVNVMEPWLAKLPAFLRKSQFNPALTYYGTGESAHWPTQSNCNIFAALAVLSASPDLDVTRRSEVRLIALALLRYALATHLTGDEVASDGKRWGHHWISVLGLERMAHGVNAIRKFLTEDDCAALRRVMISESDWLLDNYPVEGGMLAASGKNKPESNIWNGGILLRTALDYPDAPRASEYRAKATAFLLNGLSHPLDAACETRFGGKTVREHHVGFNFTPNWSLDHHFYLNVGYMAVSLSNLAMLHFYCRERNYEIPPELYWHVRELWTLVKACTFPDGRLLRIGGDTRARYTYCQNYAIAVWLFAADYLNDRDAVQFEAGYLELMKQEAACSGDGGFYSRRLDNIRRINYFYYARLESDAMLCLSYGARWRQMFDLPETPEMFRLNPPFAWQDEYHGATLLRAGESVRSFVWRGAQGPMALCVPAAKSDMAEWQNNLHGELNSTQTPEAIPAEYSHVLFPGGFVNSGCFHWKENDPQGEGEGVYNYALHRVAAAALPDERTLLILEYAEIIKEITLDSVKGLSLKIPNDLFNDGKRRYTVPGKGDVELAGVPGKADDFIVSGDRLGIDGALNVFNLYGGDALTVHRVPERSIVLKKQHGPWMYSLYVDEICNRLDVKNERYLPGSVLLDGGYAAAVGGSLDAPRFRQIPQPGGVRMVEFRNESGSWRFAANFGAEPSEVKCDGKLLAGKALLGPGEAALWEL